LVGIKVLSLYPVKKKQFDFTDKDKAIVIALKIYSRGIRGND
jgi:hypothetical protein